QMENLYQFHASSLENPRAIPKTAAEVREIGSKFRKPTKDFIENKRKIVIDPAFETSISQKTPTPNLILNLKSFPGKLLNKTPE
ncbi:hypothetical protein, partial [Proteus mirabilis]|uniref:hypothetical protein n=1 Tax=Proteus mirabilis TaxID=584 RepID=UPI001C131314